MFAHRCRFGARRRRAMLWLHQMNRRAEGRTQVPGVHRARPPARRRALPAVRRGCHRNVLAPISFPAAMRSSCSALALLVVSLLRLSERWIVTMVFSRACWPCLTNTLRPARRSPWQYATVKLQRPHRAFSSDKAYWTVRPFAPELREPQALSLGSWRLASASAWRPLGSHRHPRCPPPNRPNEYPQGYDSGWHTHPGPAIVQVQEGVFKIYQGGCEPKVVHEGESFIETPLVPVRAVSKGYIKYTTTLILPGSDPDRTIVSDPCL